MKLGVREGRTRTFLVVSLTTRLELEGLPGNVRLGKKATGLPKVSVANVYDVRKVLRDDFVERRAGLPAEVLSALDKGLRLVLDLS